MNLRIRDLREDADLTQKVLREGTVWLAPQFHAVHAWP